MRAPHDAVPHRPPNARAAFERHPWSMALATVGGIGFLPGGPGTYAAALALWPAWHLAALPTWERLAFVAGIAVLAWLASERAGKALGEADSRHIVIDEVLGMCVTLAPFGPLTPSTALVGFLAFRVFDMLKPPPARWIDSNMHNGLGVNLDDVVAGLWAALLLAILRVVGIL